MTERDIMVRNMLVAQTGMSPEFVDGSIKARPENAAEIEAIVDSALSGPFGEIRFDGYRYAMEQVLHYLNCATLGDDVLDDRTEMAEWVCEQLDPESVTYVRQRKN